MKKPELDYIIDLGLAVSFILSFITGIIKWPKFLPFFGVKHYLLPMSTISLIHDWSGLLLAALVGAHIVLHWKWIVCMTKNLFKEGKKCER